MDKILIIIHGIELFLLIFCIVYCIYLAIKYKHFKYKFYQEQKLSLKYRVVLSYVEYQYKSYKEGKNPYTTLRDIGERVNGYYKEGDVIEE